MILLDSSAYLAIIFKEKGGEDVRKVTQETFQKNESIFMHQVNFMEVIYKAQKKMGGEKVRKIIAEFSSPWWGKIKYMESDLILLSSDLKNLYPNASLADCIGLATAKIFKATFYTADKLLKEIGNKENIKVVSIRK